MNGMHRNWSFLCWNVRGIKSDAKWNAIRLKIKREVFCVGVLVPLYVFRKLRERFLIWLMSRNFVPDVLICLFLSLLGEPLVVCLWDGIVLISMVKLWIKQIMLLSCSFLPELALIPLIWLMFMGHLLAPQRDDFVHWMNGLDIDLNESWIFMGDFNFYRSIHNRNRPCADMSDIYLFNELISNLGLIEVPLKGRSFTWSNMQDNPLLEQLDWVFITPNWSISYPNTMVLALSKHISYHVPLMIQVKTSIPKANLFRFENFWIQHDGFLQQVENAWLSIYNASSNALAISAKFKQLRRNLKCWSKKLSKLSLLIDNCKKSFTSWTS